MMRSSSRSRRLVAVLSHREFAPQSLPPLRMAVRGADILDFRFTVIDLGRLDARQYARKLNAAAMALSARMRVDPVDRISFAVDFIRNTIRTQWTPRELDAVSRFYFAYQEFTGEEGLKLQSKLVSMKNMQIPKEILRNNPLVGFGITEGRHQGEIELVLKLLKRRFGTLTAAQVKAARLLTLRQAEALGEALLEFHSRTDLDRWLNHCRPKPTGSVTD
jgi:hypothetical protein